MASRGTARGLHAVFLEQLRGKFDFLHHPRCRLAPNAESAQLHCRATAGYGQRALRHSLCFQVQATWFLGIRAAGHSICFATSSQLCPCRLHMSGSRRTCGVRYECAMSNGAFLVLVHLSRLWHWPGTEEPRAEAKEGRRHWLLLKCAVRVICVSIKQSSRYNRGCQCTIANGYADHYYGAF